MAQQQVSGACLELEHDPFPGTRSGCNAVLLWGMALLLVPVGALMLWSSMHPFEPDITMGMGFLLVLFGLICLFGGSNQKAMNFRFRVQIDPDAEQIRFFKTDPARAYVVPFSRVTELRVREEEETTSADGPPREWFALYAVLRDGSEVWLLSRGAKDEAVKAIQAVQARLPVSTVDEARLGVGLEVELRTRAPSNAKAPEVVPSAAVISTVGQEDWIALKWSKTLSATMIPFLVAVLFLSIPAGIIARVWWMTVSSPGIVPAVAAVVTTLVGLLFVGLVALAILAVLQDYRIRLGSTHLLLEQRFRIGLLQRYLGRELKVEREQVECVQVHIKHGGDAKLVVVVRGSPDVRASTRFLARGLFRADMDGQSHLPLWTVAGGTREGHGPGLNDLVFIERYLQTALNLRDD